MLILRKKTDVGKKDYAPSDRYAYKTNEQDPIYIPVNRINTPYQTDEALDKYKVKLNRMNIRKGNPMEPIVIGYNYDLHDGHHRLEAAIKEGHTHVPCVVGGINEKRVQAAEKRYRRVWKSLNYDPEIGVNTRTGSILIKKLPADIVAKIASGNAHWVTVKEGPLAGRRLLIDGPRAAVGGKAYSGKILVGKGIPKKVLQNMQEDSDKNQSKQKDEQDVEPNQSNGAKSKKSNQGRSLPSHKKKLQHALNKIESSIRNNATESGHAFDENGKLLWSQPGGVDYVDVTDARDKGLLTDCIFTHNHPGDSSFSLDDVSVLLHYKLKKIRAVGKNYTHRIQPPENFSHSQSDIDSILKEYKKINNQIRDEFTKQITLGTLTIDKANATHTHEVWTRLAKSTGLRYERSDENGIKKSTGNTGRQLIKQTHLHQGFYRQSEKEDETRTAKEITNNALSKFEGHFLFVRKSINGLFIRK